MLFLQNHDVSTSFAAKIYKVYGNALFKAPSKEILHPIDIASIERMTGMQYDEIQRQAIEQAMTAKAMILTGGPGTGKTNTTQGIIKALQSCGREMKNFRIRLRHITKN